MMTEQQIAEQQNFVIPLEEARRINQMISQDIDQRREKEMTEIRKARAFAWYGDEWGKVKTRPVGGDNLQTAIAAGLCDLVTGVTFDNELQAYVRALNPPNIDEFQAEYLKNTLALPLAVDPSKPQWLMELLGEAKTHELDTYRRELKVRPKAREAFRRAIVDKACILKDSHYNRERNPHDLEVVIYGDEYFSALHRDFTRVSWHVHDKHMEQADFFREYPWILERYTGGEVPGTPGFFKKVREFVGQFYRKDDEKKYLDKTRDLQKPSIKVREIWYQMPPTRPGAEEFPGGWIVMTVFHDEILRVEANPYLDGRHPFHPIVPQPAEDHWAGKSWIYTHHDTLMGLNKTVSMAMFNLIESCNNYRLWNPSALTQESAERVQQRTKSGQVGSIDVVLKADKTWDQALKEIQPADVSPSIFAVKDMLQGLVYTATGVSLRREKEVDQNGKQVGGDVSMGPQIALMLDAVKEQHESLFFNLCSRGTQFSYGPRTFTLAGEQTVAIQMNPQFYWSIYGDRFYDFFVIAISDAEQPPTDPEQRRKDMIERIDLAIAMTEKLGNRVPLYKALAVTKPEGWVNLTRDLKRAEIQEAQNPNKQLSPQEAEKQAIRENELMKSIAQVWQSRMQEKGRDPTQGPVVDQMIAAGQLRGSLEAAIAGQPQAFPIAGPQLAPELSKATNNVANTAMKAPPLQQAGPSAPPLMVN
jgi:hypothetical protein